MDPWGGRGGRTARGMIHARPSYGRAVRRSSGPVGPRPVAGVGRRAGRACETAGMAVATPFQVTGTELPIEEVERVARGGVQVELSTGAKERVAAARAVVDRAESDELSTYGLNTGV